MANHYFLKIEGPEVKGDSKIVNDGLEIHSWSFGATLPTSHGSGADRRTGKPNFQELSIMRTANKNSPELFDHCVTGNVFKKVTLSAYKQTGDKPEEYYHLVLTDAMINSIQSSASSEQPVESVTFRFNQVHYGFNPENAQGTLGGFIDKGYDLLTQKPV